jgi:hypothetical protein
MVPKVPGAMGKNPQYPAEASPMINFVNIAGSSVWETNL